MHVQSKVYAKGKQSFKSPAIAAAIAEDSCWRGKQLSYAGFCAKKSWPLIALFSWQ